MDNTYPLAEQLVKQLQKKQWFVRCVESCTAGALTAAIGAVSGASTVLDRSWITYSNRSKHEEVGVPLSPIESHGAVSKEVVMAMADGAVGGCEKNTTSIAISGIAGPSGGTSEKPVGTVWIAIKIPSQSVEPRLFLLHGTRAEIQAQAVSQALSMIGDKIAS